MHQAHGANGRGFTDKEAHGDLEVSEKEMNQMYVDAVKAILEERTTVQNEAQRIAKERKTSLASEMGKLNTMVGIERGATEAKAAAAKEAEAKAPKAKRGAAAKPAPAAKPARVVEKLEQVPPAQFAKLRDELGLSNKQCAEANAEAGLGSTLSRITELTHSKGSTVRIWGKVEPAWRAYAKAHKIKPAAAATA